MFVDIYSEFKKRRKHNASAKNILNLFLIDSCMIKEFLNNPEKNDLPEYFNHPEDVFYL